MGAVGPRGLTDAFREKYELVEELGQGGMGTVYRARDRRLEREVAIKFLISEDAESRARFAREAKTLARVQHPNVTVVFEVGDDAGVPYLVSELVAGESLAAFLERAGKLPEGEAARLGGAVARGLAAVHAIGVIHRDLKPANVLLGRDGVPKICDFGLARSEADEAVTRTGAISGTPEYLAPELMRNGESGAGCDVYALGCMLYQMLAGSVPFPMRDGAGNTRPLLDVLNDHARSEPGALPPAVSMETAKVVMSCLAKEPAARPTADEVRALLESVAPAARSGVSSKAVRSTGRVRVNSSATRTVVSVVSPPAPASHAVALGVAAAVLLVGAGAYLALRKPAPAPVASVAPSVAASPSEASSHPIDARDPANALRTLEQRLKSNPRRLSADDAAVARALPAALLEPSRVRVRALDDRKTQAIPAPVADQVALALLLLRDDDRKLALAAIARLLAGPPRADERLLLELVGRHAEPAELANMLSAVRLPENLAALLPDSRIAAMHARALVAAGKRDEAVKIVTGVDFKESVLLAELKLELGLLIDEKARYRWDAGGTEMVYVPPGPFWMGEGERNKSDSSPKHQVWLSGYFIDRYETTIPEYKRFHDWLERTHDHRRCGDVSCAGNTGDSIVHPTGRDLSVVHELAEKSGEVPDVLGQFQGEIKELHPVSGIDWFDSVAFARWTGRQLPTEAQWEKAARGNDARLYPWGSTPPVPGVHANFKRAKRDLSRVDKRSEGQSPYGCYDMSGNVEEWVADCYEEHVYDTHVADGAIDPRGPATGADRVRRGGANTDDQRAMITWDRSSGAPWKTKYRAWGFRCAYPIPTAAPVTTR